MTTSISKELLDQVSAYVAEHMGLHFPPERRNDLERGLRRAAHDLGFDDAESCARAIVLSPLTKAQIQTLATHLTVGETYFFRDNGIFDILEGRVLPEMIRKRGNDDRNLRIWSAGCSTGEEAYSISVLLKRMLPDAHDWNITILGTDINPSFLRKASEGVYGEWSFRGVPSQVKDRCFRKVEKGRYQVLAGIRNSVSFFYHNLAEDPYPSLSNNTNAMDIIFCRNVLMYFSKRLQKDVVRKFGNCLVEGGLLIVSPIELSAVQHTDLAQVNIMGATFYRKEPASPAPMPVKQFPAEHAERPAPPVFFDIQVPSPAPFTAGPAESEETKETAVRPPDTYREALLLYGEGNYDEAEENIKTLLARSENAGPALALLARIRANRGELTEARELCEKALAADKMDPGRHYLYATILLELGSAREAVASLRRALYLDPNFVLAHFALGMAALRRGKTRESEKHFENARTALRNYAPDDILPESEGMTAGRMEEVIMAALREEVPA